MGKEIELIPFLERVMKKTATHYQGDFNYDAVRLRRAAEKQNSDRIFYWMARPCGTWLVTERDAFLKGSDGHSIWTHYGDMAGGIQAYCVTVTGIYGDMPLGIVRKLDYPEQVKRVAAHAIPAVRVEITFMSGERREVPAEQYPNDREWLFNEYGMTKNIRYCPADEAELARILAVEHLAQKPVKPKAKKRTPRHGAR